MSKIKRLDLVKKIQKSIKYFKVTALIGPRQVGKTTLAKEIYKKSKFKKVHFFDLEDPTDFDLLSNPKLALSALEGLIVIDEIQIRPELFKYLRVKSDEMSLKTKILILGSSSRDLIESASESLAGRINYIEIHGISLSEFDNSKALFFRGGFPLSLTARSRDQSYAWRKAYSLAYLERDLKGLGIDLPSQSLRRFIEMLAGYHGQILNLSELGKSIGISHTTVRKYVDILVSTFLLRELKPFNEQIIQRQVKQPKIFFRDSGILNYFLSVQSEEDLYRNPRLGSLWEGFAMEESIKSIGADTSDIYFWSIHQGGELDLLWIHGGVRTGFEFKYADSPRVTKSMHQAIHLLKLDHLYVVYPGDKKSVLDANITLIPLSKMSEL